MLSVSSEWEGIIKKNLWGHIFLKNIGGVHKYLRDNWPHLVVLRHLSKFWSTLLRPCMKVCSQLCMITLIRVFLTFPSKSGSHRAFLSNFWSSNSQGFTSTKFFAQRISNQFDSLVDPGWSLHDIDPSFRLCRSDVSSRVPTLAAICLHSRFSTFIESNCEEISHFGCHYCLELFLIDMVIFQSPPLPQRIYLNSGQESS